VERSSGAAPSLRRGVDPQQNGSLNGSPLAVAFRVTGEDTCVIELVGELALSTIPKLEGHLFKALSGHDRLILDLRRVCFIDSSGIALLIKAHRATADGGVLNTVISRRSQVDRVLALAGIDRALPIFFDLDVATADLGPPPKKDRAA
jgi:anti-sigma B factor antagonist